MVRLPSLGDVSRYRFVVAVTGTLAVSVVLLFRSGLLDPPLAALFTLFVGYLLVSSLDRVRTHPLFDAASAASTATMFGLLYAATQGESTVLLALTVLAGLGVIVELYNYRNGTAYLRIDF